MLMLTVSSRVSVGAFSMSFIAVKTMYIIHQTRPNASYVLVGIVYCYFGGLWPAAGVPVRIDAEIGVSGYRGHNLLQTVCALAHFHDTFQKPR